MVTEDQGPIFTVHHVRQSHSHLMRLCSFCGLISAIVCNKSCRGNKYAVVGCISSTARSVDVPNVRDDIWYVFLPFRIYRKAGCYSNIWEDGNWIDRVLLNLNLLVLFIAFIFIPLKLDGSVSWLIGTCFYISNTPGPG